MAESLIQFDALLFWSHSLLWPFSNNFYFKAFGVLFLGRMTGSIRDRLDIRQYFLPETFFVKVSKEKRWWSSLPLTPLTRSFFLNFCFLVDCTVIEASTAWLKESSSMWRLLTKEIKRKSLYLSVERKKGDQSKRWYSGCKHKREPFQSQLSWTSQWKSSWELKPGAWFDFGCCKENCNTCNSFVAN